MANGCGSETLEVTGRDAFHAQLIVQEGSFWRDYPETFTKAGFDAIVQRRGFNPSEVGQLSKLCDWFGLKFKEDHE